MKYEMHLRKDAMWTVDRAEVGSLLGDWDNPGKCWWWMGQSVGPGSDEKRSGRPWQSARLQEWCDMDSYSSDPQKESGK